MQALTLVVLLSLGVAVRGSLLAAPLALAQPAHHPALVLDPHGRPLDTAEVISARALHLNAKALEHYAPAHIVAAPLAHAYAAPFIGAHSAYGLAGHGHYLKKRSLGHLAYGAPLVHSAVVPAVVAAPAAVSHQSRVDVHSSPAIVAAPVVAAHSVLAAPAHGFYSAVGLGAHGLGAYGLGAHGLGAHGHYLKKRSLGHLAYAAPVIAPAAVSHQARVDVISSPAVVSHAVAAPAVLAAPALVAAPAAVSHQSRVDVRTSPAVVAHAALPLAHSAVLAAPAAHLAHSGLLHASPYLHHAW